MFFLIIKYTENASKDGGLKGIKPLKLSTQNVKKNYGKSSGRAQKKSVLIRIVVYLGHSPSTGVVLVLKSLVPLQCNRGATSHRGYGGYT